MALADTPHRRPLTHRLFFAIPVIGWMARDLIYGDKDNIWYALVAFISLWASSALVFGLPGLYIPAVMLVPVIWVVLLLITRG
ncbi:hypothetical protein [Thalassococcus sp. S3]|uniref:hypothetical protein n=1 Tax=Thalassococcus sp. S3 TaxID=2017482 RepID=UPI001023F5D5|nr:hypothetical protein [Thalassococcus sp. S3]QBF32363.1 hypothetical protein CFI11_14240 [Thalassococcus sp. S3]